MDDAARVTGFSGPGLSEAGFAEPVLDSQATFRAVLTAMSRPGTRVPLPACPPAPPRLGRGLGALALAFADLDTPLWLDAAIDSADARAYLAFHCGAPLAAAPAEAAFALIGQAAQLGPFAHFALGDPAYPDRSTTLFIRVNSLAEGAEVQLRGPGIREMARMRTDGLPAHFWQELTLNHARFPLGVDIVLTDDADIAALPRTTRVSA